MDKNKLIEVEVAYARPGKQVILPIVVNPGTTIEEAIEQSGILAIFPEIDLSQQTVGVFSEPRNLRDKLATGDRIEIYRSLAMDPKEARRKRAVQAKR